MTGLVLDLRGIASQVLNSTLADMFWHWPRETLQVTPPWSLLGRALLQ